MPEIARPVGVPEKYVDHAKLMIDMQVLAYQSDLTRVTSFMLGKEISNRSYPEIGVPEPHHSTSHHQNDPEKVEKNIKINTLHVGMFAYYDQRPSRTARWPLPAPRQPDGRRSRGVVDALRAVQRTQIEAAFRSLQSELGIRLIYHPQEHA